LGYGVVDKPTYSVRVGGPKGSTGWYSGEGEPSYFGYVAPKIYADLPNNTTCYILNNTKDNYTLTDGKYTLMSYQKERDVCAEPIFKEKYGINIINHKAITKITDSWLNGKKRSRS